MTNARALAHRLAIELPSELGALSLEVANNIVAGLLDGEDPRGYSVGHVCLDDIVESLRHRTTAWPDTFRPIAGREVELAKRLLGVLVREEMTR